MLGLETALALALTELPELDVEDLIRLLSIRPAEIAGLADHHGRPVRPGEPANLCVFDPDHQWTVERTGLASIARNTPFHGRSVRGAVRHTFFNGEPVVLDGKATR